MRELCEWLQPGGGGGGHLNTQGLFFKPGTDILYAAEHGPRTDDEVHLIERGRNYG